MKLRTLALACLLAIASTARADSPPAAGGAPAKAEQYRVGPADVLDIKILSGVVGEEPIALAFPVGGDGTIDVVYVGRLNVAGLTTSEIQERIRGRLVNAGVFKKPFVSVNVTSYLSQCVNVAGAVKKQGRFCLSGPTHLLDVLSTAEGVDEEHAGSKITIVRAGASEPIRVDRRDLHASDLARAQAANIRVLAGDNVIVAVKARACVSGAVKETGCYYFEDGDTLQEGIALAGGLLAGGEGGAEADRKNVVVRRRDGTEIRVDLDATEASLLPRLEADDQIRVGEVAKLRFCVNGAVSKPDCYDYQRGLTIEGAISKAAGLLPDKSDRNHVSVRRDVAGKQQEINVDLDDPGDSGSRFLIMADDQIVVPTRDCLVSVGGGVRTSGNHPVTTGMTLTDAINLAGGSMDDKGFALGNIKAVSLKRGEQVQVHNLKEIWRGRSTDPKLQCGDRIFVPNRVTGKPGE